MVQNADGGWGESVGSSKTIFLHCAASAKDLLPSQTAWAILGLLAVGDTRSDSVARGVAYLMRTQKEDGSWDEPFFTRHGIPSCLLSEVSLISPILFAARADDICEGDGEERQLEQHHQCETVQQRREKIL